MRQIEITEQPIVRITVQENGQIVHEIVAAERFVPGIWEDAEDGTRVINKFNWNKLNEKYGMGPQIAETVYISTALSYLSVDRTTSVNFHTKTLEDKMVQKYLGKGIENEKFGKFAIEVTEHGPCLSQLPEVIEYIHGLKELGIDLWMDDVGSPDGVHTFEWVKTMHAQKLLCMDAIKLEMNRLTILQIVNSVAWAFASGITSIIEQIETVDQRDRMIEHLQKINVDLNHVCWQGNLWGEAVPIVRPRKEELKTY